MTSDEVCTSTLIQPCRYQIREKIFAFTNSFKIKDEFGQDKYTVRSKKWTLGKKLVLEDINGNALFKIRQNGIRFLDQFNILSARDGDSDRQIASIRQKFTFFKHSYIIYSIYGEYKMKGLDIFDHSFTLKNKNNKTIAIVNKKYFSFADSYEIEMIESNNDKQQEDHAFILALIIVLHCSLYCS
ncbi:unnamed protein product [Adineta steineri]|uniref:Uncharacterized protein n=2 Tax=Adineta steineri TaxID=433720 RepID=A0A818LV52_9BILA|nr:unnamed protein product [Adineta steineri]